MGAEPLYEYAVEFRLHGVHTLPVGRALELAASFGKVLDRAVVGVRVVRASVVVNAVRCVCVALDGEAVHAAARSAHLAPDFVYQLGEARERPAPGHAAA